MGSHIPRHLSLYTSARVAYVTPHWQPRSQGSVSGTQYSERIKGHTHALKHLFLGYICQVEAVQDIPSFERQARLEVRVHCTKKRGHVLGHYI